MALTWTCLPYSLKAEEDWLRTEAEFLNKLNEEEEERTVSVHYCRKFTCLIENQFHNSPLWQISCVWKLQMKENAEERTRREMSAVRVQCAFRMFAARKILRQEIRALFVKEFDAKRRLAVYRNTFSGDKSLRKPFGLGSEELEFPDQWFLLADASIGE